jgi:hypothetical protein
VQTEIQGDGTISSSAEVGEGESKTIRWSPKDGSEVSTVIVDGVIRDDLLTEGEYSFNDIENDHQVEVLFTEKTDTDSTSDDTSKKYISIKTQTKGQGTISNSKNVKNGTEQVISWEAADGWKVAGVLIDGKNVESLTDENQITIKDASTDHTVQVIFVPADGSEPGPAYTVTTDIVGGEGEITATGEAQEDGKYVVTWKVEDGYEVVSIIVDGVERNDLLKDGSVTFDSINENHTIQVKVQPKSEEEENAVTKTSSKSTDKTDKKNAKSTKNTKTTKNAKTIKNTKTTKNKSASGKAGGSVSTGDGTPIISYMLLLILAGYLLLLATDGNEKRNHHHRKE